MLWKLWNWWKNLAKCCNLPKFFHHQCFLLYGTYFNNYLDYFRDLVAKWCFAIWKNSYIATVSSKSFKQIRLSHLKLSGLGHFGLLPSWYYSEVIKMVMKYGIRLEDCMNALSLFRKQISSSAPFIFIS